MPRSKRGEQTTALPTEARQLPCETSRIARSSMGRVPGNAPAPAPSQAEQAPRGPQTVNMRHNADVTDFVFDASTSSQQVTPGNPNRGYLAIQNRGSTAVFLSFGKRATTASFRLVAGAFYEPLVCPTSSINILGSSGGESVVIIEGNYDAA